ncbi:hypothetical protein COT83_04150 [Candidatus Peregrinibacteria bacterium CG10_big_fil_rev_8_21_14_0_10_44_7]|nr:MAG: hypothetical protein COT83_04150 [Candidatus Peregrinibacteria bacterium CG10_big_fil_rev_8_21_14_0_10_44_7]
MHEASKDIDKPKAKEVLFLTYNIRAERKLIPTKTIKVITTISIYQIQRDPIIVITIKSINPKK